MVSSCCLPVLLLLLHVLLQHHYVICTGYLLSLNNDITIWYIQIYIMQSLEYCCHCGDFVAPCHSDITVFECVYISYQALPKVNLVLIRILKKTLANEHSVQFLNGVMKPK